MGYFILFKHDKGWVGNQIIKAQMVAGFSLEHTHYTHIAVSGGGQYIVEIAPPCSKVISIFSKYNGRYVKIVKYKADDYERKRYKVAFWAATQSNLRYDWFGVLRFKIKWLFQSKGRPFCSENALWSLQKEYPKACNGIDPSACYPADFLNPKYFDVIWEGFIS